MAASPLDKATSISAERAGGRDSLAALGILATYETRKTRRWKPTRPAA